MLKKVDRIEEAQWPKSDESGTKMALFARKCVRNQQQQRDSRTAVQAIKVNSDFFDFQGS